jgi:exopolysaccharide biosynthesis polyprenyl glycosylphosphotransferase
MRRFAPAPSDGGRFSVSVLRDEAEPLDGLARAQVLARARRALLRRRDSSARRLLAVGDCASILLAFAISMTLVRGHGDPTSELLLTLLTLPAWVVLFKLYGLYDRDAKRVSHSTVDDIPWVFHALVIGAIGLYALLRLLMIDSVPVLQTALFAGIAFVTVLLVRVSVRELIAALLPPARVLFVGSGPMARLLDEKIERTRRYGLEPVGYIGAAGGAGERLRRLGDLDELEDVCSSYGIEHVMFVAPAIEDEALEDLVRRTRHLNVRLGILPHVVDALGPSVEVDHVQGVTVLGVNPPKLSSSSWVLKRTMDVAVASFVFVLALPAMALIAALIKLTSRGPVLFAQERVGYKGKRFRIYKFRTMVADAEARADQLKGLSKDPNWLLLDRDPRVTRVGRFLRHTSLDELPQLWNVIVGDMSLVGPRPMPPDVDDRISGWGRKRLDLTPGLTGLWQVLGRTSIPFEEMVKLDYLYVTNWSLWQDIRLLIQTLPAVVFRRGVN